MSQNTGLNIYSDDDDGSFLCFLLKINVNMTLFFFFFPGRAGTAVDSDYQYHMILVFFTMI